jgi:hypothetical protein
VFARIGLDCVGPGIQEVVGAGPGEDVDDHLVCLIAGPNGALAGTHQPGPVAKRRIARVDQLLGFSEGAQTS